MKFEGSGVTTQTGMLRVRIAVDLAIPNAATGRWSSERIEKLQAAILKLISETHRAAEEVDAVAVEIDRTEPR